MEVLIGTVAVVGVIGLIGAILLVIASRAFAVEEDERLVELNEALPGANCGACGYAGCEAYANAVLKGAPTTACVPGGTAVAEAIAKILGVEAEEVAVKKAYVACKGSHAHVDPKFEFEGEASCAIFSTLSYTSLSCPFGCLGYGDCARACPFDAITVVDRLAHIDSSKCTGCGVCLKVCPRNVILMAEQQTKARKPSVVTCMNTMPGKTTRQICDVGCIGCGLCKKECPVDAISIENHLANVDLAKCIGCGKCNKVCPTSAIDRVVFQPDPPRRKRPPAKPKPAVKTDAQAADSGDTPASSQAKPVETETNKPVATSAGTEKSDEAKD
ncbi:MAG: RnfABCDGE type electron transport complex subunit B [Eggerthellaceae bacterium]